MVTSGDEALAATSAENEALLSIETDTVFKTIDWAAFTEDQLNIMVKNCAAKGSHKVLASILDNCDDAEKQEKLLIGPNPKNKGGSVIYGPIVQAACKGSVNILKVALKFVGAKVCFPIFV